MDSLLNLAPCGYMTFGDDGLIVTVNTTLLELLDLRKEQLQGKHIESILPTASRIFYQTHFFPLLKLHGRADEIYLSLRRGDGGEVPVLVNAVRHTHNGIAANDCVLLPMRRRRRYENELLQARKEAELASQSASKFMSMMSHELRTPLQAIFGYTEILSSGTHGSLTAQQLDDLRRINSASEYLLGLINDVLNYARLEPGRLEAHGEKVSVVSALARAEGLVEFRIREKGHTYERSPCSPELSVCADPERLQQVLLNLLTNAIKFTPAGGIIRSSCERAGESIHIAISDSGPGIAADHHERIFDPFVQIDRQQVKASLQGAGLGLAISRALVRNMGGDLTVRSAPGRGSIFTVSLPVSD